MPYPNYDDSIAKTIMLATFFLGVLLGSIATLVLMILARG
jgi:hypothetical protein